MTSQWGQTAGRQRWRILCGADAGSVSPGVIAEPWECWSSQKEKRRDVTAELERTSKSRVEGKVREV